MKQKNGSTGLSDKASDIILVVLLTFFMLLVAYPLYYVLVASVSDPYPAFWPVRCAWPWCSRCPPAAAAVPAPPKPSPSRKAF